MMESYDDDVIITRYYGKYFKEDNKLKNYCDIFKKEISERKKLLKKIDDRDYNIIKNTTEVYNLKFRKVRRSII